MQSLPVITTAAAATAGCAQFDRPSSSKSFE